jgi:hypothetical protein
MIAEDEVAYKLGPKVVLKESGSEESSEGPVAPEPSLRELVPVPAPAPASARVPETRRAPTPRPQDEGAPTREQPWRNINPATWEPLEHPFQKIRAELSAFHNEY